MPSWAHIFSKHPGCWVWEQRFGNGLYLNTYEYLETVLKLQWYSEAIWLGDFRGTFRLKIWSPALTSVSGVAGQPIWQYRTGLDFSQMLEPDTQLNASVAIATQQEWGRQENLLASKMSNSQLSLSARITPFCNSRSLTSQFSHLTCGKTKLLRRQRPGPWSYNYLTANPGIETRSPESHGKFVTLTPMAGKLSKVCLSSSFDSACGSTVLRWILRLDIHWLKRSAMSH